MKIFTIRDIAQQAGVGVSTVSRVLNNRPDVNPVTRQRVMAVVEKCHYTQNSNAKHLKQHPTGTVGVIVRGRENTFLYHVAEKMLACSKHTGHPFMMEYIGEKDNELEAARQLYAEKKVEGFILLGASLDGREKELKGLNVPMVIATCDMSHTTDPHISSVSVDDRAAACAAIDHLMAFGHRRIAVLGGCRDAKDAISRRYLGVLDSFQNHGLSFDENLFIEVNFNLKAAYEAAGELLRRNLGMTAVFCMSDMTAIGAMKCLNDQGLKVPRDVSVVGFDGIELGRYVTPSLCTIRQPAGQIAAEAVALITSALDDQAGARHVLLPTQLVPGASVQAVDVSVREDAC